MGGGLPMGILKSLRQHSVVPPNTSRKTQIMRTVAFLRTSRSPGSTQLSRESVSTSAMPPLRPACHIMKRCFQDSSRRFSGGKSLATKRFFMQLETTPRGKVASARPTRQNSMAKRENTRPVGREKTAAKPTNMKTAMSARDASCFSRKDVSSAPSTERCGAVVALMIMPQKSTAMMPDLPQMCSAKWYVKKGHTTMKRMASAGEFLIFPKRMIRL
mmetsp:Transcript_124223/g.362612  ORF Transcript_124223/g.362612 Transcript_124223/m.362612 type:complete len:216 (-) Transcript_124223:889-1536(-)